jgi:transcriptional regulator with GAF, ATPase, and Fis domain
LRKPKAVQNIDAILEASDGLMVARGDLGVEMDVAQVPIIQKDLIRKCQSSGKPVIVATQMLQSMIENSSPTRAEVSDVANAIFDGTDVVMLSGETGVGKFPVGHGAHHGPHRGGNRSLLRRDRPRRKGAAEAQDDAAICGRCGRHADRSWRS